MAAFSTDLRAAARALRRAPAFTLPALASVALGAGTAAAGLTLFRLRTLVPLRLAERVRVDGVAAPDWGQRWSDAAHMPAALQQESLRALLLILFALSIVVLAIACLSALVLLAGRASARRREMAVRAALGAAPRRLLGGLAAEGGLLAGGGIALGALVGAAGVALLHAAWPAGLVPWASLTPGLGAAGLALALPALGILALSPAPAAGLAGGLRGALAAGARTTTGRGEGALRNLLAGVLVAGSLTLLAGAGMLLRSSFPVLDAATLGFDPNDTLTFQVDVHGSPAQRAQKIALAMARIRANGGVLHAGYGTPGVWLGVGPEDRVTIECPLCTIGEFWTPIMLTEVRQHVVDPGLFPTLGLRVVEGRGFDSGDGPRAAPVMLVNRALAATVFQGHDPVGRQIRIGTIPHGRWYRIAGVVDDVGARGLGAPEHAAPTLYFSALQHPPRALAVAIRAARGDPADLAPAARSAFAAVDPTMTIHDVAPMTAVLARFAAPLRWLGVLFALLAGAALLLALHGVGSAMAFNIARRRPEIGARMALGATPARILRMVLRETLRLTAGGAALGLIGAIGVGRVLQQRYPGVRLLDPGLLTALAATLVLTALLAAALPALRAATLDPALSLRAE